MTYPTIEEVKKVADVCGAKQCRDMVKFTNEQLQAFAQHWMKIQRERDAKPVIIPQSAEQLHIKELREALNDFVEHSYEHGVDGGDIVLATCESRELAVKALDKQPDTRALEKTMLEARIEELTFAYGQTKAPIIDTRIGRYEAKLAELDKEK